MFIAFTLSMPGCASWDGKWSGASRRYVIIKDFGRTIKGSKRAAGLLAEGGYWSYSFGDGWVAGVQAKMVDGKQARKLRVESDGFCGYDWMVRSILAHGKILNSKEEEELKAQAQGFVGGMGAP